MNEEIRHYPQPIARCDVQLGGLHEDRARAFMAQREREPAEWYRVATFSESTIEATADELAELNDKVEALIAPYRSGRRRPPRPGARTVSVVYRAFPFPNPDVKH